jgi:hypothetical protein
MMSAAAAIARPRWAAVIVAMRREFLGITEFNDLPQGLYSSARASALAQIDAGHDLNALIVADLSNDTSYAEQLMETFGPRVIGLHIEHGDGMQGDQ